MTHLQRIKFTIEDKSKEEECLKWLYGFLKKEENLYFYEPKIKIENGEKVIIAEITERELDHLFKEGWMFRKFLKLQLIYPYHF